MRKRLSRAGDKAAPLEPRDYALGLRLALDIKRRGNFGERGRVSAEPLTVGNERESDLIALGKFVTDCPPAHGQNRCAK